MSGSNPTLLHLAGSVSYLAMTDVPPAQALIFDLNHGGYRIGDGINTFANLPVPTFGGTQDDVPVTGGSIALSMRRIILTPAGTLAALTFVLPTTPVDGQELYITSNQNITLITWTIPSGQIMDYGPTTLAKGASIKLFYNASTKTWFQG